MSTQPVFYAYNNAEAFTDLPAEKLRNDSIDSLNASKLSAYARLDFKASSFYLQTLHAVIGRTDPTKDIRVDIDLGALARGVSRRHAKLFYDLEKTGFVLAVLGFNGVAVDNVLYQAGDKAILHNGSTVQIGDVEFKFVLPTAAEKQVPSEVKVLSPYQLSPSRKSTTSESTAIEEEVDDETAPCTNKPPFLIHQLILNAIRAAPPGCTGLSYHQITLMIQKLYPYYGSPTCKEDWKPAVKFNLVHNKMFTKITSPATANGSKKRKWVVDEHYLSERQKLLSEEEQQTVPDTTTPSSENKIYNNLAHYKFGGPAAHSKRRRSSSSSSIRARRDSLSQNPDYIKFIKTLKAAHSKSLTKHKAAGTSNEMSPDVGPFIKLVLRTLRARHMDLERLLLKAYTFEDAEAQRQLLSVIKMVLRSTFGRDVASPPPSPGLNKPAVRKTAGVSQGPKLVQV